MKRKPAKLRAKAFRERGLDAEKILLAAITVLDRDGYDGLTMRAIAEQLGTQAGALYWHIKSREELEDRLFEHLHEDMPTPTMTDDWRVDMRRAAEQYRRFLASKRDITRLSTGHYLLGPNLLRLMDATLGLVRRAGLSAQDAAIAMDNAIGYILSAARSEAQWRNAERATGVSRRQALRKSRKLYDSLPLEKFPNLVALAREMATARIDARFRYGVECLIAGAESQARKLRENAVPNRTNGARKGK
jgi:TetR/AcrR family transcriptional regulator, tetracycline repressor protein